jgi:hypothetical protein
MRDHKAKMRLVGKNIPKEKAGRKAIKKEPKPEIKFAIWRHERKITKLARAHYKGPIDQAEPADYVTDEETTEVASLFMLHELKKAIDYAQTDEYLLFDKKKVVVTDPTNHTRGVVIHSY